MAADTPAAPTNSTVPDEPSRTWVVILAGGVGTRFWPASIPQRPKQLLPLGETGKPLVAETVERALRLAPRERLRILTGEGLRDPILRALPDLSPEAIWTEPRARGTGPALLWAAHRIALEDPGATMVSLHSDHVVGPEEAFAETLQDAVALAAETGLLFTVAAAPDRPETGYGYIRPGTPVEGTTANGGPHAFRVARFQEKPDEATARRYVEEGHLWNTGIFVWRTDTFLQEVRDVAPEVARSLEGLPPGAVSYEAARAFFRQVPAISVDHAVLERSNRVAAVRAGFRWDDVGSWGALARTREADDRGNVAEGPAHVVESSGNIAYSGDGRPVVLFGVEGLVVVRTPEATLVTTRERASELKRLVDALPDELRAPPARDDGATPSKSSRTAAVQEGEGP